MNTRVRRGRLLDAAAAPASGERFEVLATAGNVVVEQILSAEREAADRYLQPHDEWVVVLAGAARLEVDGEALELGAGEWVLLPRGVPHTVLRTAAGTNWLAVHVHPTAGASGGPEPQAGATAT